MIPEKFKIFGKTIAVEFDNEEMNKEGTLGTSDFVKSKIILSNEYKGKKLSLETIKDVFYHEKVHMILDSMHEHKLSRNEKFVEVFSRLLQQSEEKI